MTWFKSPRKSQPGSPSDGGQDSPVSTDLPPGPFTPRAQQALANAREEAQRLRHNFVGTEHLLLGLIKLGQGVAVNVLKIMGVDLESVRSEVRKHLGVGSDQILIGPVPYTTRVKKVLSLADKERTELKHTYLGTEHILLGLLVERDGVSTFVLRHFEGVDDIEEIRVHIMKELDPNFDRNSQPSQTRQLYDVYCSEGDLKRVVYRDAYFTGGRKSLKAGPGDTGAEFLELEQSNGQRVYVPARAIIRFCDAGTEIDSQIDPLD